MALLNVIYPYVIVPFSYGILIAMLILFSLIKPKTIKILFGRISGKAWILLLLVFLSALALRLFVFPHYHHTYLDEQLYIEYARNIDSGLKPQFCDYIYFYEERCTFRPQTGVGWPVLLSLIFGVFGPNTSAAFYFSSIIGSLSVILVFLLSYLIFKSQDVALWSSLLMAFTPLYVVWSNSAGNNMPSLFFVLLTLVLFFAYFEARERKILALFALAMLFSFIVRYESIIVAAPLLLVYIMKTDFKKPVFKKLKLFCPSLAISSLAVLIFLEVIFGRFFSVILSKDPLNSYFLKLFPFLQAISLNCTYLVLVSLGLFFIGKKEKGALTAVFTFFLFFFILYLPIYSDGRMALVPGTFLLMLSAYSIGKFSFFLKKYVRYAGIFIVFVLIAFLGIILSLAYDELYTRDHGKMLETYAAAQIKKEIPEGCYFASEWPMVLSSISGVKGIYSHALLKDSGKVEEVINAGGCIYYFYDGYCSQKPISPSPGSVERCRQMLDKFDYRLEKEFRLGNSMYFLYRVIGLSY